MLTKRSHRLIGCRTSLGWTLRNSAQFDKVRLKLKEDSSVIWRHPLIPSKRGGGRRELKKETYATIEEVHAAVGASNFYCRV